MPESSRRAATFRPPGLLQLPVEVTQPPVRVQFNYEIVRASDGATLATGSTVHAALDRTGKPCRLPARVRTVFT